MQVWAGLGGLQVQSGLGEPFSGSIVVTGEKADFVEQQQCCGGDRRTVARHRGAPR